MIGRRGFITGLISLVAAPAIVRAGSLMPVKVMVEPALLDVYGRSPLMDALEFIMSNGASRYLEIDRTLMDRLGPEYRGREEQRVLAELTGAPAE